MQSAEDSHSYKPNSDADMNIFDTIDNLVSSAQSEIEEEIGLLLYGSGGSVDDVTSAKALSILSVKYVSDLCEAAMRNHEAMVGSCMSRSLQYEYEDRSRNGNGGVHNILYPLDFGVDVNELDLAATAEDDVSQSERSQEGGTGVDERGRNTDIDPESSACLRIGSQPFIRAVMHDRIQYGRIKELLSARRSLAHDLLDQTILSAVQDEVGDGGTWPGTEDMLPLQE